MRRPTRCCSSSTRRRARPGPWLGSARERDAPARSGRTHRRSRVKRLGEEPGRTCLVGLRLGLRIELPGEEDEWQPIDERRAFELLRTQSQRSGKKLFDVAEAVLESHLLLFPPERA